MKKYIILLINLLIVSTGFSQDLFFSEYAEGSSNNKYLEIYNPTSAAISLDGYAFPSVGNAPTTVGVHEYWNTFSSGATIAAGGIYIIAHPDADQSILDKANQTHQYLSNGDDGYALAKGTENNHTYIDFVGNFDGDPGSGWNVAGVSEATKDHTLIRKASVVSGNTDWTASAGTSTEDSEWIVKDQNDWTNLGSHTYDPSSTQDTDVQFATTSATVNEGDGTASITVSLSYADPEVGTSVELHLTDGTASDLGDFTFQTLTWDAGNSDDKTVTVTITDDTDIEETETFTFTLKDISGGSENAAIGTNSSFVLTIIDNDNTTNITKDLFISEAAEGSASNKYLEFYNPTSETISLDGYAFANSSNGSDGNYEFWNTFTEGATIEAGAVYVIMDKDADESIISKADQTFEFLSNGDDGFALVKGTESDYTVLDRVGDWGADPGSGWDVAGVSAATKDHTLVRKASVVSGNSDWTASAGTSTEDSEWIVKDQNDWDDLGKHNEVVEPTTKTKVEFEFSSIDIKEGDVDFQLGVKIYNESSTNATSVEVYLVEGSIEDLGSYSTDPLINLNFDAGVGGITNIGLLINDDDEVEGKESLVFGLRNVVGGESAEIGDNSTVTINIYDNDYETTNLVLNEFLADPASDDTNTEEVEGDANGDGVRDSSQDEFIELINSGSESMDLSGYEIYDRAGLRHTFADGSLLPAGMPYVVFGGGNPSNIDNPRIDTASTGFLGLNNGGDLIIVKDNSGTEIIVFEYGGITGLQGGENQSLTRDPDITGNFVLHSTTAGGLAFSPGLKNDNVSFDADGDGVADDYDNCPDTPEGESVDENGCADSQKDTDGDGVNDDIDECANTPSGAAVDAKGCELPLFVEKVSFINKIYPNPASEILKVELDNSTVLNKYVINDLNGKVILTTNVGQKLRYLEIDIKSFNNGLFILNLEFEKGNSKVKFLKE